jgi:hypothetical protein
MMGVIIFGRERDQAGLLVELKPAYQIDINNEKALIDTRNMLWSVFNIAQLLIGLTGQKCYRPIVEEANRVAPAFSRIFKEMILIASADKPLPRAGKGTVMRKAALVQYQTEIDNM